MLIPQCRRLRLVPRMWLILKVFYFTSAGRRVDLTLCLGSGLGAPASRCKLEVSRRGRGVVRAPQRLEDP